MSQAHEKLTNSISSDGVDFYEASAGTGYARKCAKPAFIKVAATIVSMRERLSSDAAP